jgi:membrane-bound ClpP family serine protease
VIEDSEENGAVYVGGQPWAAKSPEPVLEGQSVLVTAVHGLTLHIEPISKNYREDKDHV